MINQPLKVEVIFLVSEAIKNFSTSDISQTFSNLLLTMLEDCESTLSTTKTGWFNFHRNVVSAVLSLGKDEDASRLTEQRISFHQSALQQRVQKEENNGASQEHHEDALAQNCWDQGNFQYRRGNYTDAITSFRLAVDSRVKLFGEEHYKTTGSYHSVEVVTPPLLSHTSVLLISELMYRSNRSLNISPPRAYPGHFFSCPGGKEFD